MTVPILYIVKEKMTLMRRSQKSALDTWLRLDQWGMTSKLQWLTQLIDKVYNSTKWKANLKFSYAYWPCSITKKCIHWRDFSGLQSTWQFNIKCTVPTRQDSEIWKITGWYVYMKRRRKTTNNRILQRVLNNWNSFRHKIVYMNAEAFLDKLSTHTRTSSCDLFFVAPSYNSETVIWIILEAFSKSLHFKKFSRQSSDTSFSRAFYILLRRSNTVDHWTRWATLAQWL